MTERETPDVGGIDAVVAPVAKTLGWKVLDFDVERSTIRVEFQARTEFLNRKGTIQGGFLAAMLDSAMGTALGFMLSPGTSGATARVLGETTP